jgi:hypothetical protein
VRGPGAQATKEPFKLSWQSLNGSFGASTFCSNGPDGRAKVHSPGSNNLFCDSANKISVASMAEFLRASPWVAFRTTMEEGCVSGPGDWVVAGTVTIVPDVLAGELRRNEEGGDGLICQRGLNRCIVGWSDR